MKKVDVNEVAPNAALDALDFDKMVRLGDKIHALESELRYFSIFSKMNFNVMFRNSKSKIKQLSINAVKKATNNSIHLPSLGCHSFSFNLS